MVSMTLNATTRLNQKVSIALEFDSFDIALEKVLDHASNIHADEMIYGTTDLGFIDWTQEVSLTMTVDRN